MQSSVAGLSTSSTAPREIGGHTLRARKPVLAKPPAPKKTNARVKKTTADCPVVPPELENVAVPRPPTRWFRHGVLQPGSSRAQRVGAAPTMARAQSASSARSGSRTAVESEVATVGENADADAGVRKMKPSAKTLGKRKAATLDDIPEVCEEKAPQARAAKRPRAQPAATPRPRARKRA